MTYPFSHLPTLREFVDRVISDYGGKQLLPDGSLSGPRGKARIEVLVRAGKGRKKKIAIMPALGESEVLTPHVLRSLCKQLGIRPEDFDMILDVSNH
jgi:hypothetical protein